MNTLPSEQQFALLQNTLRFLTAEWQQLADVRLKQGQGEISLDEGQYLMGQSRAFYQVATAIQLLINKAEMQLEDEELAPLAIARDIVKATIE